MQEDTRKPVAITVEADHSGFFALLLVVLTVAVAVTAMTWKLFGV